METGTTTTKKYRHTLTVMHIFMFAKEKKTLNSINKIFNSVCVCRLEMLNN